MAWQDSDNSGGKSRMKYSPVAGESLGADKLLTFSNGLLISVTTV
jgi:hypothetical protein